MLMTHYHYFCLLALGLAVLSGPQEAMAQERPTSQTITVSLENGVCLYEIEGQADQDLFTIAPGGMLTLMAEGTDARVEIQPDPTSAVPGVAAGEKPDVKLKAGDQAKQRRVRSSIAAQRVTEHKVAIRCCDGFGFLGLIGSRCGNEQEARARTDMMGMAPGGESYPDGIRQSGPQAPAEANSAVWPPVVGGGPVMEVEDDG